MTEQQAQAINSTFDENDSEAIDDVALRPGPNADSNSDIDRYISPEVLALYDVYSYRHGAAILATSFPQELAEIEKSLLDFRITTRDIGTPGGNESVIPKKFSKTLRPSGWVESRIQGDLLVRIQEYDELFLSDDRVKKLNAMKVSRELSKISLMVIKLTT